VKFVLETGMNILIHGYDINMISITGINADHPDIKSGLIDEWDADNPQNLILLIFWILQRINQKSSC